MPGFKPRLGKRRVSTKPFSRSKPLPSPELIQGEKTSKFQEGPDSCKVEAL
jgi:hypothetical protein